MRESTTNTKMKAEISTWSPHSESPRLVKGDWMGLEKSPPHPKPHGWGHRSRRGILP